MNGMADIHFYFDPVCPFAWMTSKWARMVMAQRDYTAEWRFISLRQVNAHLDYDQHFPHGYEAGHTAGLRLLRVCARTREEYGADAVGSLYEALGTKIFDSEPLSGLLGGDGHDMRGTVAFAEAALTDAGLSASLATAVEDESWDLAIQADTDEALSLTGKDVGTPIIHFGPPDGAAFFGPVISRLPHEDDAVELWDHVVALANFPGFAELKRSLRELPQLRGLGVEPDETGKVEDWEAGRRVRSGD